MLVVWYQNSSQNRCGPNEDESLDLEATERHFTELTETINDDLDVKMSPAEGAVDLKSQMRRCSGRSEQITEAKGHVVSDHRSYLWWSS
nr:CNT_HP1_G0015810.mRNA.1.CDS.1 [Saccharomyces cerevisiae]